MNILDGLRYTEEHEWVKVEDGKAYIGITDYAQHTLGEAVYVELPKLGASLSKGDVLGVVESVKAASDVYSPVSGKVLAINGRLEDEPGMLNQDPYGSFMAVLQIEDESELAGLMDAAHYKEFCGDEDE